MTILHVYEVWLFVVRCSILSVIIAMSYAYVIVVHVEGIVLKWYPMCEPNSEPTSVFNL